MMKRDHSIEKSPDFLHSVEFYRQLLLLLQRNLYNTKKLVNAAKNGKIREQICVGGFVTYLLLKHF